MRVLLVHNFYQRPGGEDQVFLAESRLLQAAGHEVLHHTVHNDEVAERGLVQLARDTIWNRSAGGALHEIVRDAGVEVVHFHNTFPLISPAAYRAVRSAGAAVVQTLHNYRLLCPGALLFRDGRVCETCVGSRAPVAAAVHGCYRNSRAASGVTAAMLAVHHAAGTWRSAVDVYVALTEFGRAKFVRGGLPAERIVVKPHFLPDDPGAGAHEGGNALFVGRLSAEKGVATLLRAWSEAPVPLRVIGTGPLDPLLAAAPAGVEWLGQQERPRVLDEMKDAAFLVFPSECYETFGLVAIEAYAAGLPVIAARIGGMHELVRDGETGLLFTPGDPADLASKVRWAAANPAAMRAMGAAARREYERRYTAGTALGLLEEVYEVAMARRHGGRPSPPLAPLAAPSPDNGRGLRPPVI
jgi:glycosyltransferase involved in cell wall biosynthesis